MSKQKLELADELEAIKKRGHFPNDSLIEDVVATLRSSAESDDYFLPCDVKLPPATTITKGCKLSTLMAAFKVRERAELEVIHENLPEYSGNPFAVRTEPQTAPKGSARVSIEPMQLSDGRTDYYVAIRVGDKFVTPHVFREEYKAAYHVALYDWLLNGTGEEPCVVDFGPEDYPARVRCQAESEPQIAPSQEDAFWKEIAEKSNRNERVRASNARLASNYAQSHSDNEPKALSLMEMAKAAYERFPDEGDAEARRAMGTARYGFMEGLRASLSRPERAPSEEQQYHLPGHDETISDLKSLTIRK